MLRSNGPGRARCLLGGLLLVSLGAHAQTGDYPASTYESEYLKRLKSYETITPYGESPFGESIDLTTGQVSFSQTDIVLEGTGPTIRVSRSRSPEIYDPSGVGPAQVLGDWSLDIPRISTLVPSRRGATNGGSPGENWDVAQRCTSFGDMSPGSGNIDLEDWWHGYELVMPDGSTQPLLQRDPAYTVKPAGTTAYPIVTLGDVQMSCLASTKNGEAGEAFQSGRTARGIGSIGWWASPARSCGSSRMASRRLRKERIRIRRRKPIRKPNLSPGCSFLPTTPSRSNRTACRRRCMSPASKIASATSSLTTTTSPAPRDWTRSLHPMAER
jgi:hypothetical protein